MKSILMVLKKVSPNEFNRYARKLIQRGAFKIIIFDKFKLEYACLVFQRIE